LNWEKLGNWASYDKKCVLAFMYSTNYLMDDITMC
jgi:hypothetical protein